jgi:hypothetical protein
VDEVTQFIITHMGMDIFMSSYRQLGIPPANITDPQSAVQWVVAIMNRPAKQAQRNALQANQLQSFNPTPARGGHGLSQAGTTSTSYIRGLGADVGGVNVDYGTGTLQSTTPIGDWYKNFISKTKQTSPLIDKLLSSGEINRTYVKGPDGKPIPFGEWLQQTPNAAQLLADNKVQITVAGVSEQEKLKQFHAFGHAGSPINDAGLQKAYDAGVVNEWENPTTYMGAASAQDKAAPKTTGATGLAGQRVFATIAPTSIAQLGSEIASQINNR